MLPFELVLPEEVLCCIFDHLDVADMRIAALVCQRWSNLVFSRRRMNRVLLRPKPDECSVLMNSKRNYRHIYLKFLDCTAPIFAEGMPEKILHKFESSISSLRIESGFKVTKAMLRKFLLEVPNLQELTIHMSLPAEDTETIEFPALAKLKYLELRTSESDMPLFRDALNLPTNSPRLEELHLCADRGAILNVIQHFSPQLKVLDLDDLPDRLLFVMNFPCPRNLQLWVDAPIPAELSFNLLSRLRSIEGFKTFNAMSEELFATIASNCLNLTYLGIGSSANMSSLGIFKCLDKLTKLKHLELFYDDENGACSVDHFYGCGVMPCLQKISFHEPEDITHWTLLSKQVAPNLKYLQFTQTIRHGVPRTSKRTVKRALWEKMKHLHFF